MQELMAGVKIDFQNMTLEKLENLRNEVRKEIAEITPDDKATLFDLRQALSSLNHQILIRKLLGNKYRSTNN